tara:strand:- start:119458 stop:119760 length:303 start_codon:yes stop_codon:yes gene_type:complete
LIFREQTTIFLTPEVLLKIHYIAIAMLAILGALIIFAKFFAPREKKFSTLEGEYAEAILGYTNSSDKERLETLAYIIGERKGLTKEESMIMLEQDLKQKK